MRKLFIASWAICVVAGLAACMNNNIGPTDTDIFQSNENDIINYANSLGLNGTLTSSGSYFATTQASSSTVSPAVGQEAEFNYTIYALSSGGGSSTAVTATFADSTYATTSNYIYLTSSSYGFPEGILRMHEGEKLMMLLPSILAFGRDGAYSGKVPANAAVRLDVTLKRTRTEDQQINDYVAANNIAVTQTTADGVRFILTKANPTGAVPTAGQVLTINYAGRLLRATTGFTGGTGTGTKTVGTTQYITGFEEGLSLMKVGEKATVIFPSALGYGATGSSSIPAYAPLVFDLEIVSAQ